MFLVAFLLSDKKTKLDILNLQLLFVTVRQNKVNFSWMHYNIV